MRVKCISVVFLFFLSAVAALADDLPDAPKPKMERTIELRPVQKTHTIDMKFFLVVGTDGLSAIADAITTERMLGRGCHENNTALYGSHPSPGRLAGANAAYFAGEVAAAYVLKRLLHKHRWLDKAWMIEPLSQTVSHAYYSYQNENLICKNL